MVEKDGYYSHPFGKNWPQQPPNYIGFRYAGKLQSVHHIDSYKIVKNLATINRKWPRTNENRFLYRLGPPMRPCKEIKSGKSIRNRRVECAIDTLLSGAFDTLDSARNETSAG
jgi:hypothetical protein